MRRALSFIMTLALMAVLILPVAAAEPTVLTTDAFAPEVRLSATDAYSTGTGLGFCFTLNAANVGKSASTHAVQLANATLDYQDTACRITAMGAVITHLARVGTDACLIREAAVDNPRVVDVTAKKMYRVAENYAMYAARIVDIPFEMESTTLYARPYVEIEYEGQQITLYGGITSANYTDTLAAVHVRLPGYGDDVDGKKRLFVGDTSVLCDTLYIEIQDELDEWMIIENPDRPDKIFYACYDANGQELSCDADGYGEIILPAMSSTYATTILEAPLAEGTAEVRIVGAEIIYWTEWEI